MAQTDLQTSFLRPDALLKHVGIDREMTVADLGMGSGYFTFAASDLVGPHGTVYAVDINTAALSNLKSRININGQRNIVPVWADIEKLGSTRIPDNACDAVFLVKVLYQVPHREKAIAEAARILRPKGTLVVVEWRMARTAIGPDIQQRVNMQELERELTVRGFKVAERPEADDQHSILILTKE